jgi:hypothetical protein
VRVTRKEFLFAGTAGLAALAGPAAAADPGARIDVRQRGARGDGVADDTAAIQAAIDAAPADGGMVFLPAGVYRLTRPLEIVDDTAHANRRGLQVVGAGGGASGGGIGCLLHWDGPDRDPMLRLWSRDCVVRNLTFRVLAGRRTSAAIDVDQAPERRSTCTNNTFEDVFFTGGAGAMTNGVVLGERGIANVEYMGFSGCYWADIGRACVDIRSRTLQSKAHRFYKCAFTRAPFAILQASGSFVTFGCSFGYLTEAAVRLGSITDHIAINESDSEGCPRLLSTGGGSPASWPVKIDGGRFALNGLAPDGRYIDFTDGGPLLIQNALFGDVENRAFRIRATSAEPGAVLVSIGNVFPNDTPYDRQGRTRLVALGNRGRDAAGEVVNLEDEIAAAGAAQAGLALATVRSIGATAVKGRNLRGAVRITGAAATGQVVFDAPEPDAQYYVAAVASDVRGGVAAGATRVAVADKTATGFRVALEAAPGPGASVTIDWIIVR